MLESAAAPQARDDSFIDRGHVIYALRGTLFRLAIAVAHGLSRARASACPIICCCFKYASCFGLDLKLSGRCASLLACVRYSGRASVCKSYFFVLFFSSSFFFAICTALDLYTVSTVYTVYIYGIYIRYARGVSQAQGRSRFSSSLAGVLNPQIMPDKVPNVFRFLRWSAHCAQVGALARVRVGLGLGLG